VDTEKTAQHIERKVKECDHLEKCLKTVTLLLRIWRGFELGSIGRDLKDAKLQRYICANGTMVSLRKDGTTQLRHKKGEA